MIVVFIFFVLASFDFYSAVTAAAAAARLGWARPETLDDSICCRWLILVLIFCWTQRTLHRTTPQAERDKKLEDERRQELQRKIKDAQRREKQKEEDAKRREQACRVRRK